MTYRRVYFFGQGKADAGNDDREYVGGKGASLGEMTRAGLNVPPGFTISTLCCREFFDKVMTWPAGLEDEVRASLARLENITGRSFGSPEKPLLVAVRSGAAQSMPGMMDTVLNVGLNLDVVRYAASRSHNPVGIWLAFRDFISLYGRTVLGVAEPVFAALQAELMQKRNVPSEEALDAPAAESICLDLMLGCSRIASRPFPSDPWGALYQAINAVFLSWNSERAQIYRARHGFDCLAGTAVNVQAMCPSEVSGVMFTANPVDGRTDSILIEASEGLGEAIVLGRVTPDRYVIRRNDFRLMQHERGGSEHRVSAFFDHSMLENASGRHHLNDDELRVLAELGVLVEQFFGVPSDIEWGRTRGQFFLLQARPIRFSKAATPSAFSEADREKVRHAEIEALRSSADPAGTVWAKFNLSEILPTPTPMTWEIVRQFMAGAGGFGQMYRDLGFDPDPALAESGAFDLVCGRPYCNLSREPRMQYKSLPFEHNFELLKKNPAKAIYPQAIFNPRRATWKFWIAVPWHFFKLFRSNLSLRQAVRTFADNFRTKIVPDFCADVERAWNAEWSQRTDAEILDLFRYWERRTLFDFARESLKPTALAAVTLGNLERYFARRFQPSPEPSSMVQGLARAQAAIRTLVMGAKPEAEADLAGGMQLLQQGRLSTVDFLRRFGHRGSQEMELSQPRWRETPEAVESQHRAMSAHHNVPHSAFDFSETWRKIADEARIFPGMRRPVEEEIQSLLQFLALREEAKNHFMKGYELIRRALLELDRRQGLSGEIFFLHPGELPALVAESGVPGELRKKIDERKCYREIALSLRVPQVLFSDDLEVIGRDDAESTSDQFQGVGLSSGEAEAEAWVVETADAASTPPEKYVLVCPSTDPAWLPLFLNASGLVMETGGVLSHGAIVARELGLPAVAGIPEACRKIRTGQRIHIDGGLGRVSIVHSGNAHGAEHKIRL